MNKKKSFLYIPDISGFTSFVKKTEIQHSRHIISELLELIIDSDELGLTVAEIEGDAILFYKHENRPSYEDVVKQTEKTFLAFHNHLKLYEKNRICPCGACSMAPQLTIKFIAHAANFEFIKVKEFEKPYGADVILAHRLLKNNITAHEYLLMTSEKNNEQPKEIPKGLDVTLSSLKYAEIGSVDFQVIQLESLHQKVALPAIPTNFKKVANPSAHQIYIDSDIDNVFEVLTNFELRLKWNIGVKKIDFDKDRVNRVGAYHTCIVNGSDINFETIIDNFGENKLVYGELLKKIPFAKEITAFYVLEKNNSGTNLTAELHMTPLSKPFGFISNFFKKKFLVSLKQNFEALKVLCESEDPYKM